MTNRYYAPNKWERFSGWFKKFMVANSAMKHLPEHQKEPKPIMWHWILECEQGHAVVKTKEKCKAGAIIDSKTVIALKYLEGKLVDGQMVRCKCGAVVNTNRRVMDNTWKNLE